MKRALFIFMALLLAVAFIPVLYVWVLIYAIFGMATGAGGAPATSFWVFFWVAHLLPWLIYGTLWWLLIHFWRRSARPAAA